MLLYVIKLLDKNEFYVVIFNTVYLRNSRSMYATLVKTVILLDNFFSFGFKNVVCRSLVGLSLYVF